MLSCPLPFFTTHTISTARISTNIPVPKNTMMMMIMIINQEFAESELSGVLGPTVIDGIVVDSTEPLEDAVVMVGIMLIVDPTALLVESITDEVDNKTIADCIAVKDSVILVVWSITDAVGPKTVVEPTIVLDSITLTSPSKEIINRYVLQAAMHYQCYITIIICKAK